MVLLLWIVGLFIIAIIFLVLFGGDDEAANAFGTPVMFIFSVFILSSDFKFDSEKEYSGYGVGSFIVDTIPHLLPIGAVAKVGGTGGATKSITRVGNTYR